MKTIKFFVENIFSAAQFKRELKNDGFKVKVTVGGKFDKYDDGYQEWEITPTKKCTASLDKHFENRKMVVGAYIID